MILIVEMNFKTDWLSLKGQCVSIETVQALVNITSLLKHIG